jgi:hypothetical protein
MYCAVIGGGEPCQVRNDLGIAGDAVLVTVRR